MHHSEHPMEMTGELKEQLGLGPTGEFPGGKLTSTDEGEIKIAISHQEGKVILNMGKPTAWIGFSPAQAREIAGLLQDHAAVIEDGVLSKDQETER